MEHSISGKKMVGLLIFGMLGCILMGGSDWLMIYGDTAYEGSLAWLTNGAAQIASWRNALALMLAFPAVILYSVALFAIGSFYRKQVGRRRYLFLTSIGMTPWLCIHLFYIMILYLFAWMQKNGSKGLAFASCEALFGQFIWLIPLGQVLMLLPFLYLLGTIAAGKTVLPCWMALNNPLLLYLVLKGVTMVMPDVPFRLAFVNGLMSEAMLIFFIILAVAGPRCRPDV